MRSSVRKGSRVSATVLSTVVVLACSIATMSPGTAARPSAARDFTYEDINPNSPTHGQQLSLSALYAEHGVVLNFLASWCKYCWKELPELDRLQKSTTTPIVGIAADEYEGPDVLLGLIRGADLSLPILLVPKEDIEAMEQVYDHRMLPATYVIDPQGWVRRVFEGLMSADQLMDELRPKAEY